MIILSILTILYFIAPNKSLSLAHSTEEFIFSISPRVRHLSRALKKDSQKKAQISKFYARITHEPNQQNLLIFSCLSNSMDRVITGILGGGGTKFT